MKLCTYCKGKSSVLLDGRMYPCQNCINGFEPDSKPVKYRQVKGNALRSIGQDTFTLDQIMDYFEPVEKKLTKQETIDLCHSITKGKKIEKIKEFFGTRGTISFETALQLANKLNELTDVVNSLLER